MADYQTNYTINYDVKSDQANAEIEALRAQIAALQAEVQRLKDSMNRDGGFVNPAAAAEAVDSLGNIQAGLANLNLTYNSIDNSVGNLTGDWKVQVVLWDELIQRIPHLIEYAKVLGEVSIAVGAVGLAYAKWDDVVRLTTTIAAQTSAFSKEVSGSLEKAALQVSRFATEYLKLGSISGLAKFAGEVAVLVQFAEASIKASNAAKDMTLEMGNLSKEFTDFDKTSYALEKAQQKYALLEDASRNLGRTTEQLFGVYKELFDALKDTSVNTEDAAHTLTDLESVLDKLRSTDEEATAAHSELSKAFQEGTTNVEQLSKIFGASLYPALDAVAKQLGLTRDQLIAMIDKGQIGSDEVLPALARAAVDSTKNLDVMSQATKFSHEQIATLIEKGKVAATDAIPGMSTALGQSVERITATDKAMNNLSTSWGRFLQSVGDLLTQKGPLTDFWQSVQTKWDEFFQYTDKGWDETKASIINGLSEVGIGASALVNDVKQGFTVIGETIGNVFGAISTWDFSQLGSALDEMLQRAGTNITNFNAQANEWIRSLWGGEDASKRSKEAMDNLGEAIKKIPLVNFSDDLEELFKKINKTTEASDAVNLIWKELSNVDPFSGKDQSTLTLAAAIQKVQTNTGDAQGTLDAFAKKLSELPSEQLVTLLNSANGLKDKLKELGDTGQVQQVILSAAFDKLKLDASSLQDGFSKMGKETISAFAIIASNAESTGAQIREAFNQALESAKTQKDIEFLQQLFANLAQSGKLTGAEIAAAFAAIGAKQEEIRQNNDPLEASFRTLGVTSTTHLDALSRSASKAFSVLENNLGVVEDTKKAFWAWAEAEVDAANAANRSIDPLLKQKAAQLGLTAALEDLIKSHQKLPPEQQAVINRAEYIKQAFDQEASAAERNAQSKLDLLESERELAIRKGYTYTAYQKGIEIAEQELQTLKDEITTLENAIKLEDARANAIYAAAQLQSGPAAAAELEKARAVMENVKALKEELAVKSAQVPIQEENVKQSKQVTDSVKQETQAKNTSTFVTQEEARAQEKNTEKKKEGAKASGGMGAVLAGLINYWTQETKALSEATYALFQFYAGFKKTPDIPEGLGISQEAQKATNEIKQLTKYITYVKSLDMFTPGEVGRYLNSITIAGAAAKKAYYEQKLAAEELIAQNQKMAETGVHGLASMGAAMGQLTNESLYTAKSFNLLNNQDLDRLQASIAAATNKLKEMQEEADNARDAIAELNAEILEEKGQTEAAEQLKLQLEREQKIKEVTAELERAKLSNNRELIQLYEEQLRKLNELYDLKERNLQQDEKENKLQKENNSSNSAPSASGSSSGESGTTHRLELKGPSGKEFHFASKNLDINSLIDELDKAGLAVSRG
jgi:tape measure domain-containing protein